MTKILLLALVVAACESPTLTVDDAPARRDHHPASQPTATPRYAFPAGFKPTADDPYPCTDPADVCSILSEVGCAFGRSPACLGAVSPLPERTCLKLANAMLTTKSPRAAAGIVPCNVW